MNEFEPGALGIVSQSGNLALELSLLGAEYGIGISRFASLGNQADIEAAELVEAFAADEHTRVIGVYCEDFRDGRAFARAGRRRCGPGKQVVLLAAGGSEAGARAAASHTGALASDSAAVDAACRAAGIMRVTTPKQLSTARSCLAPHRPIGRRVAIVGDGGGTGVVTADLITEAGLELPRLSPELAARLTAIAPTIVTTNPVDLAGAGEQDFWNFERVTSAVLESGEATRSSSAGYFGGYSQMNETFARSRPRSGMRSPARRRERPPAPRPGDVLGFGACPRAARGRCAVYRDIEAAVDTLARLVAPSTTAAHDVPALPERRAADHRGRLLRGPELLARVASPSPPPAGRPRSTRRHRRRGPGLPGRAEGAGAAAQVGRGRRRARPRRRCRRRRGRRRHARAARTDGYSVEPMVPTDGGVELIVGAAATPASAPLSSSGSAASTPSCSTTSAWPSRLRAGATETD